MSPEEARLLALERRVIRIPVLDLERRAAALEQSLAQSWTWGGTAPPPAPPVYDPTLVYIGLRCWGEGGVPFAGCPVTIKDGSGTTVDSGTSASDGTYVSIGLSPAFYTATTSASSKTRFQRGQNFLTTGVVTWLDALIFATGTTLTAHDSVYGNQTLTWSGVTFQWSGTHSGLAVAACGSCPGAINVPVTYTFANNGGGLLSIQYLGSGTTNCPVAAGTVGAHLVITGGLSAGPQVYSGGLSLETDVASGATHPPYCTGGAALIVTQP